MRSELRKTQPGGKVVQSTRSAITALLMALTTVLAPASAGAHQEVGSQPTETLTSIIGILDTAVFDAFNKCSDPAQLALHASYFSPDVEFYHDEGGVTWTRDDMIDNTAKYACGNYTRELVPGTLRAHAIKDFGAIATGTHRFCAIDTGGCAGMADFVLIWRNADDQWQITRSLSFGHRASE